MNYELNRNGSLQTFTITAKNGEKITFYNKLKEMYDKDHDPQKSTFWRKTSQMAADMKSPEAKKFYAVRATFFAQQQDWPKHEIDNLKAQGQWDEDVLWTIEFRLRTPTLKALGIAEIDRLYTADENGSLWYHLTHHMVRILTPDGDTNKSRWETAPWWKQIQEIHKLTGPELHRIPPTPALLENILIKEAKAIASTNALAEVNGISPEELKELREKTQWWSGATKRTETTETYHALARDRYNRLKTGEEKYQTWLATHALPTTFTIEQFNTPRPTNSSAKGTKSPEPNNHPYVPRQGSPPGKQVFSHAISSSGPHPPELAEFVKNFMTNPEIKAPPPTG